MSIKKEAGASTSPSPPALPCGLAMLPTAIAPFINSNECGTCIPFCHTCGNTGHVVRRILLRANHALSNHTASGGSYAITLPCSITSSDMPGLPSIRCLSICPSHSTLRQWRSPLPSAVGSEPHHFLSLPQRIFRQVLFLRSKNCSR